MARALELARRGLYTTSPNPRVGSVVVNDGRVVGEGWHERAGEAHAEIRALGVAREAARGATAYITLEPCSHTGRTPPCTEALLQAGVARVVCAMADPNPRVTGVDRLREAGVSVDVGLCEAEARALNPGYVQRMESGRPWVRLKTAASLDGQTAMASGESQWITGPEARADVQKWRARSCAVVTGTGTVAADDPRLDVRIGEAPRQPLRVVVGSPGHVPRRARVLEPPGDVLMVAPGAAGDAAVPGCVEVVHPGSSGGHVDLAALLRELAEREVNEVLVEAGPRLSGAFLQAGLVDEVILYLAPKLLGRQGMGMFELPGVDHLAAHLAFRVADVRAVGSDLRALLHPA